MIRVLLADDQALVRAGFRALLDAQEGIEVVGEAADGDEAVRLARALRPDVVLMDIRMPGLDGLEATRAIAADELLAGVRIVQESLTNVTRHAGSASATVLVRYGPDDLTVRVDDDGRGPAAATGPGNGIRGMRERVAALGGELTTGPRPGGGFRVQARLPLDESGDQ